MGGTAEKIVFIQLFFDDFGVQLHTGNLHSLIADVAHFVKSTVKVTFSFAEFPQIVKSHGDL